jgi:HPr kinase/phosphorylase
MSIASISVETIVREHPELEMQLISGEKGISKKISNSEINRPGLSLPDSLIFLRMIEFKYLEKGVGLLNSLSEEKLLSIAEKFFSYSLSCIIFTHGNPPQKELISKTENLHIPLFVSPMSTHKFITLISDVLNKSLAPRTMRHGVLIEVFGIGILLSGRSGVG